MAKKRHDDDLDTETTFADMNVEGFRWYDPSCKDGKKRRSLKLTRKEYWAMVRGAFAALWPVFVGVLLIGAALYGLAFLWLGAGK